jgi:HK97 family phage major capsid protein
MSSNAELIKKADIALSDLVSDGGLLSPEQTDRFIRTLIDSPTVLNAARVVTMNAPTRKINKIGFGSRILRPAVSATALDPEDRVKPTTSQVVLNTKEVIAEVHIPYDVLEDNIERGNINAGSESGAGGLHETIVQLIAERAALDLEELVLLGDSISGDPYLALVDGWMKLATAHTVDAGNTTISKTLLKNAVKAMPDKYLRNRSELVHFVSVDNETELRDTYASRATNLGDTMLQGLGPLYAWGSQVLGAPMMPAAKGLFTNPLNLIFGIQRRVTIEYDKDIRTREFIIVLTTRVACEIEEDDAVVKYLNIA